MKPVIALLLFTRIVIAQETQKAYEIPFASKGNEIELSIANKSTTTAEGIKVEVTNAPAWLKFDEKQVALSNLNGKEEKPASFVFSVDKMAEVKKEQIISFTITDRIGEKWTKEITIKIAPPATYELFQNYPNPFNPATKIEYQLPAACTVSLKIYNIQGREVATQVAEQQEAGYHQTTFDAHRLASGMYIYRIIASDEQNNRHVFQKKMLLLK